jgi:hypothetical protein
MPRFGTSQLEFPLEVSQRHVEIAHIVLESFGL